MNTMVSCIIPSYKRADTLKRAIDSVLAQTYKEIEVLVVDDNIEGDEYSIALLKIIESYNGDPRVILVTQPKHINGAEARNAGVRAANGDFVAFLDDDDEWLRDKLEYQMRIFEDDTTIDGVAGGACLFKGNKPIYKWAPKNISENGLLFKVLIREVGLATSTFICKKSAFLDMGGFNTTLNRSQDLQLFADFLQKHRIYPTEDVMTVKMHVEDSVNRLDAKKLAANKEEFFAAIEDVMNSYSKLMQLRIKSAHHYEIAYVAIKEHNIYFAIKHIILGLKSFRSIFDVYKRFKNR